MRQSFKKIMMIIICCLFLSCLGIACAGAALQYELTHDKIKDCWISGPKKGPYEVTVELNESNKKSFSQLTEKNVGKKLQIIYSGRILTTAVIRGAIDSGFISIGVWNSEEDARKIKDKLTPRNIKQDK